MAGRGKEEKRSEGRINGHVRDHGRQRQETKEKKGTPMQACGDARCGTGKGRGSITG